MSRECVLIRNMMKKIDELWQTRDKVFQTPPIEWTEDRLPNLKNRLRLSPTTQL